MSASRKVFFADSYQLKPHDKSIVLSTQTGLGANKIKYRWILPDNFVLTQVRWCAGCKCCGAPWLSRFYLKQVIDNKAVSNEKLSIDKVISLIGA
jgi:hypothetical protein